jgi:hypothetical protein
MAHLKNKRDVQKDLERRRRCSAVGNRPERMRNAFCPLRGHEKRFGCFRLKWNSCYDLNGQELRSSCCRLSSAPVSSMTSPRTRAAHCGARVPVGDVEGDRSGCGETEHAQPPTRDIDACSDGSASVTRLSRLSVFSSVRSSSGVTLREAGEVIQQDSRCRRQQPSPDSRGRYPMLELHNLLDHRFRLT